MKQNSNKSGLIGSAKPRLQYIDLLKAFTIFCVLWGHAIQQFNDGLDWFHCTKNPVFSFIYLFHMPLFFMVSGFFFKSSLRLNFGLFLRRKALQLLLPWAVWLVIVYIYNNIERNPFAHETIWQVLRNIFDTHWFWFLKEIFISYSIMYVCYKLVKKGYWAAILGILIIFIIPPEWTRQRVYLPMFLLGILLKECHGFITKHIYWFLFGFLAAYAACLPFWDAWWYDTAPQVFIWKSMSFNFDHTGTYLYRLLAGGAASLFYFTLFQVLYRPNRISSTLSRIGIFTLEIYILQVLIIEHILTNLLDFPRMNVWFYSLVMAPVAALLVLTLELGIIKLIYKSKTAALALFGSAGGK
ncbi:hypothetical protein FACS1894109_15030 [Spirochaetia bacterium]|nr:hypothetical protein FACS1894109_15030 [Spirochaetia bacterium]